MRGLARILYKKFGIGGVMILIGVIGVVFAVMDSSKNMPGSLSIDFKNDLAVTAIGFIGGAAALFIRMKRLEKKRAADEKAAEAAQAEAERRAKSDPNYYSKPKVSPESVSLKSISDKALSALPRLPYIPLFPEDKTPGLFDCKLGGLPYLPKNFPYPMGRDGIYKDKPLRLLCQLNFEKLPHIPDFPEKGILQFFCSCGSDPGLYGLGTDQDGWRVVYHENIIKDIQQLTSAADMPEFDENADFPFEGEFVLRNEGVKECDPTAGDFRFEREFIKAYNSRMGTRITSIYDEIYEGEFADGGTVEDMYNSLDNSLTCIGGYPDFTQRDPRRSKDGSDKKTVLLFQLESCNVGNREIMWGDMGVGNFFISAEDLKNKDFSRVMFNWDCC